MKSNIIWQQNGYVLFFPSGKAVQSSSLIEQTVQTLQNEIKAQERAISEREKYIAEERLNVEADLTDAKAAVAKLTFNLKRVDDLIADSEAQTQHCKESELAQQAALIEGMRANRAKIQARLEEEENNVLALTEELAEVRKNSAAYEQELPQARKVLEGLQVKLACYLTDTIVRSLGPTPSSAA